MAAFVRHLARRSRENFGLLFQFKDQVTIDPKTNQQKVLRCGVRRPINPIRLLLLLNASQWMALMVAFVALFADFLDFNVLAAATKKVADYFGTSKSHVSDALTYSMLMRLVGAIIFGLLGDMYGRKWPLIFDLTFLGCLQIASIYCTHIGAFLGIRALFGIGMGGIWGCAAAQLMEQCPVEARGLVAAMMQNGAACSGLTAAGLNLTFGPTAISWKKMFWVSAAISFFAATVRLLVPESPQFVEAAKQAHIRHHSSEGEATEIPDPSTHRRTRSASVGLENALIIAKEIKLSKFWREFKVMLRHHWQTFIYCAVFVCLASWSVHAFGDNYVTMMISGKSKSNRDASIIVMIARSGTVVGQCFWGWLSEFVGRRRIALVCTLMSAALLPAAIMPTTNWGLALGECVYHFFCECYSCIVVSHLNELAPVAFRAVLPGVAYQLGTSVSAPAAQIVNEIAEAKRVIVNGKSVEGYEATIGVNVAIIYFLMIIWAAVGPERRGVDLEHFAPAALKADSASSLNTEEEESKQEALFDEENVHLEQVADAEAKPEVA